MFGIRILTVFFAFHLVISVDGNLITAPPTTGFKVDLFDGFNPASGRVVITVPGVGNGTVCGRYNWDKNDATTICRMLNFSYGLAVTNDVFGKGETGIMFDDLNCNANSRNLSECSPTNRGLCSESDVEAGVICTNNFTTDFRIDLVKGTSSNNGRVEIIYGNNRTTIPTSNWNQEEATVICRMKNFKTGIALRSSYYGPGSGVLFTNGFDCYGNEKSIFDCAQYLYQQSGHSSDGSVFCLNSTIDEYTVQLENNYHAPDRGFLRVSSAFKHNVTCASESLAREEADVVCKLLNFSNGFAVRNGSMRYTSYHKHMHISVRCSGSDLLSDCNVYYYTDTYIHSSDYIICMKKHELNDTNVFLVNGSHRYPLSGRVQLNLYNKLETALSDYSFNKDIALIICKRLGYTAAIPFGGKWFAKSIPVTMNCLYYLNYRYTTLEYDLKQSDYFIQEHCDGYAAVICHNGSYTPEISARLVNGTNEANGLVQVTFDDFQGAVTDYYLSSANKIATVICKMMNYSQGLSVGQQSFGPSSDRVIVSDPSCTRAETSIGHCTFQAWGYKGYSIGNAVSVSCFKTNTTLKKEGILISVKNNGVDSAYGILEVTIDQHTGYVCHTSSNNDEYADVMCRFLGYNFGHVIRNADFRNGTKSGPILMGEPVCNGAENSIADCDITFGTAPGEQSCSHSNDVGLFCTYVDYTTACLQLVNGTSNSSGILVVVIDGMQVPLYSYINSPSPGWFCQNLGFSNISAYQSSRSERQEMVFMSIECTDQESSITDCLSGATLSGHPSYTGVIYHLECTDNGESTRETDSCINGRNSCPPGSTKLRINGTRFCQCPDGFEINHSRKCEDIDECSNSTLNNCSAPFECRNTLGSYICTCKDGEQKLDDKHCIPLPKDRCTSNEYMQLFPHGQDYFDKWFTEEDDGCIGTIEFPYEVPIFERSFKKAFICTNGIVSFGMPYTRPVPESALNLKPRTILAPYHADIDLKRGNGSVQYQLYDSSGEYKNSERKNQTEYIFKELREHVWHMEGRYITLTLALVVTWDKVHPYRFKDVNETATVQLVFASDGSDSFVFYIYGACMMNWRVHKDILIGYSTSSKVEQNQNSFGSTALSLDKYIKTSGWKGMLYYRMTFKGGEKTNYEAICLRWYYENLRKKHFIAQQLDFLPNCPCNWVLLKFDFWYPNELNKTYNNTACSILRYSWQFGKSGKICCYDTNTGAFISAPPRAGSFQEFHPTQYPGQNKVQDANMKKICCSKSKLCDKYYEVRPVGQCYKRYPARPSLFWGDPHIQTLDGKEYTFNGLGEYILLKVDHDNETFILQARTERAKTKDGNMTDATVYSAFAARDSRNASFQVEMNENKTRLVVYANKVDYSGQFNADKCFHMDGENIGISRKNDNVIARFKTSGISLNVSIALRMMLEMSISVPDVHQNRTFGLLGNFDGNKKNDLVFPNGTILKSNASDKDIFIFGQKWAVNNSTSVFKYPMGKNYTCYRNESFIPIFLDEVEISTKDEARKKCGENNTACIYDYIATKNDRVANNTKHVAKASDLVKKQMDFKDWCKEFQIEGVEFPAPEINYTENQIPHVNGTTAVNMVLHEEVNILVSGSDDGNFTFNLTEQTSPGVSLLQQDAVFNSVKVIFTPTTMLPMYIGITAIDNEGVSAAPLEIKMTLCTNCSGHGTCNHDIPMQDNRTTDLFFYGTCECLPYWEGFNCEKDFDGCASNPCNPNVTCKDVAAVEHMETNKSFVCVGCPPGYQNNSDEKCEDIDECTLGKDDCQEEDGQQCINVEGSYRCQCRNGYRQNRQRNNSCDDIDECLENIGDCPQVCTNTKGGYNCSCHFGYEYNVTTNKCDAGNISQICSSVNCSRAAGCTLLNEQPVCFCDKGYKLTTHQTCENVDECNETVCSQKCTDTEGGYQCSCFEGYELDPSSNECTACKFPFYGENCLKYCESGPGCAKCDHVKGCLCAPGWTGLDCSKDIDECKQNQSICSSKNAVCVNAAGSFVCGCTSGYTREEDQCEDRDECSDPELYDCAQLCINVDGGYTCGCRIGYNIDPSNSTQCVDIDECITQTSDCEQRCINNEGRYNCDCFVGYILNDDRKTCKKVENPCLVYKNLNCSDFCAFDTKTYSCGCPLGSHLGPDNQTCVDIDECANNTTNKCSQKSTCQDKVPGFTCTCTIGYTLQNDKVTCRECDKYHFGANCSELCSCGLGAETCNHTVGCVCKQGWEGQKCDTDVNDCDSDPCTAANAECINFPGNYSCECKTGFGENSTGHCIDINECDEPQLNSCKQKCVNSEGSYDCSCWDGFAMQNGTCEDVNECENTEACTQTCSNTIGGYKCSCEAGYKLNATDNACVACEKGKFGIHCLTDCKCNVNNTIICNRSTGACKCKNGWTGPQCDDDINECEGNTKICSGEHQRCNNTVGSYNCLCTDGYTNISNTCKDIDECNNSNGDCTQVCNNTIGSYFCSCGGGYSLNTTDNKTCIECEKWKYGLQCLDDCKCNVNNTVSCNRSTGACKCKKRWTGRTCDDDIDECKRNAKICSGKHEQCNNTRGSYNCLCMNGYANVSNICQDIDECGSTNGGCNQFCNNTAGSYFCSCRVGYFLNKTENRSCIECPKWKWGVNCSFDCSCTKSSTNNCNKTSGTCSCKRGWKGASCATDVNECTTNGSICNGEHEKCRNTAGSFNCDCVAGFERVAASCKECSMWKWGNNCSEHCSCEPTNTKRCNTTSGVCVCKPGWNGHSCTEDVDECSEQTNCKGIHEECNNIPGSFHCNCRDGFVRNGIVCEECSGWKWGNNCSEHCTCEPTNTKLCNTTSGVCVCKPSWNGHNCTEDVDECSEQTNCKGKHEECNNVPGSFHCNCTDGFVRNGTICEDINECISESNSCSEQSICNNTVGAYTCSCKQGYSEGKGRVCELAPGNVEVKGTIRLELRNTTRRKRSVDLTDDEKEKVYNQIRRIYQDKVGNSMKNILMTSTLKGNIITINFTLVVEDSPEIRKVVAQATVDLVSKKTELKIDGRAVVVQNMTVSGVSVMSAGSDEGLCKVFKAIEKDCAGENVMCKVDSGNPSCLKKRVEQPDSDTNLYMTLTVWLGVGFSVLAVALVVTIVIACRRSKRKKERKTESTDPPTWHNMSFALSDMSFSKMPPNDGETSVYSQNTTFSIPRPEVKGRSRTLESDKSNAYSDYRTGIPSKPSEDRSESRRGSVHTYAYM